MNSNFVTDCLTVIIYVTILFHAYGVFKTDRRAYQILSYHPCSCILLLCKISLQLQKTSIELENSQLKSRFTGGTAFAAGKQNQKYRRWYFMGR